WSFEACLLRLCFIRCCCLEPDCLPVLVVLLRRLVAELSNCILLSGVVVAFYLDLFSVLLGKPSCLLLLLSGKPFAQYTQYSAAGAQPCRLGAAFWC
ncbi:hypothetical protein U1Q18_001879, partial [Sarracenia purpurea var. burkii]